MYEYLSSELFKYIILFIIISCIICFYLLHQTINRNKINVEQKPTVIDYISGHANNIIQNKKINCGDETIFSISDEQCRDICYGDYVLKSGTCVNKIILNYSQQSNNVCDASRGFYSYMLGDGQLGTIYMHCLSIDPGIQSDDVNSKNIILKNGSIIIDYKKKFPQYNEGSCEWDKDILKIPSTMNVRERGVCVSSKIMTFFNL